MKFSEPRVRVRPGPEVKKPPPWRLVKRLSLGVKLEPYLREYRG